MSKKDVGFVDIRQIKKYGLKTVTKIILHNNKISYIANYSFIDFPQLYNIKIRHNRITEVASQAFDGLKTPGTFIDLSSNQLACVPNLFGLFMINNKRLLYC